MTGLIITEIRTLPAWIGVDFLDSKHERDGRDVEGKAVNLLDYGCGAGMISRVSTSFETFVILFVISLRAE